MVLYAIVIGASAWELVAAGVATPYVILVCLLVAGTAIGARVFLFGSNRLESDPETLRKKRMREQRLIELRRPSSHVARSEAGQPHVDLFHPGA